MDAIEKRARELISRVVSEHGSACAPGDVDVSGPFYHAVAAALTPPEGYELVPAGLLRMVAQCAYPVSTDIDSRGYRWSEGYLDQVLPQVTAAVTAARPEVP